MSSFCFPVKVSNYCSVQMKESVAEKNEHLGKKAYLDMLFVLVTEYMHFGLRQTYLE